MAVAREGRTREDAPKWSRRFGQLNWQFEIDCEVRQAARVSNFYVAPTDMCFDTIKEIGD